TVTHVSGRAVIVSPEGAGRSRGGTVGHPPLSWIAAPRLRPTGRDDGVPRDDASGVAKSGSEASKYMKRMGKDRGKAGASRKSRPVVGRAPSGSEIAAIVGLASMAYDGASSGGPLLSQRTGPSALLWLSCSLFAVQEDRFFHSGLDPSFQEIM